MAGNVLDGAEQLPGEGVESDRQYVNVAYFISLLGRKYLYMASSEEAEAGKYIGGVDLLTHSLVEFDRVAQEPIPS